MQRSIGLNLKSSKIFSFIKCPQVFGFIQISCIQKTKMAKVVLKFSLMQKTR